MKKLDELKKTTEKIQKEEGKRVKVEFNPLTKSAT